ncbi:MAG: DUF288 domain-containing protein [Magnetococcales bacterium]|nr:DUF288 domain-containing protein [Magnetococcales bacterium]MBF0156777.1 DUF288 domain-containing protein [Magnetococcales bacterium]
MKTFLVVTSISAPNPVLATLAREGEARGIPLLVIGDVASPREFHLPGCRHYSLAQQKTAGFALAPICPERHYARKNLGYLLAWREGAEVIVETDDDNMPLADFWSPRQRLMRVPISEDRGWVNVYRYFQEGLVWPRGLPLTRVRELPSPREELPTALADCVIQQGLANDNPDVDAVYRLLLPLPVVFADREPVALGRGSWSPFNSQNTTWFRAAFPLLYLPAFCSFRMTDIWRSLVAQRIAWENDWSVLYHRATVVQDRNEHDLHRDFEQEIPGYLFNERMAEELAALKLEPGEANLGENLGRCYDRLVTLGWIGPGELPLLAAWIEDIGSLG